MFSVSAPKTNSSFSADLHLPDMRFSQVLTYYHSWSSTVKNNIFVSIWKKIFTKILITIVRIFLYCQWPRTMSECVTFTGSGQGICIFKVCQTASSRSQAKNYGTVWRVLYWGMLMSYHLRFWSPRHRYRRWRQAVWALWALFMCLWIKHILKGSVHDWGQYLFTKIWNSDRIITESRRKT